MRVAIEGCSHGELDVIYKSIQRLEEIHNFKVDLLICCGDFQSVRNERDLKCMSVPEKYMQMQDFHKYYSGEKKAPLLTIFIGGNHEASNYLQELPYGGWVAPNIYYLGYAGVVRVGDLRIGGLSGIYKSHDYLKGHFEQTPYTISSRKSVYHVRNLEVFRLKQLSNNIDIFLSHDWPRGIYNYGNVKKLLRFKKHFEEEVKTNKLGSRAAEDLIKKLKPNYWFSGHLHVKFSAILKHEGNVEGKNCLTKFLALDKCLPRREFLQVLEIPNEASEPLGLSHDAEWLTVLRLTNHLLSTNSKIVYMPGPGSRERYNFTPTRPEIEETVSKMGGDLSIPASNFVVTAAVFDEGRGLPDMSFVAMPPTPLTNPQTASLCAKLGVDDPIRKADSSSGAALCPDYETASTDALNASEMDVTHASMHTTTDSSNTSCNPEEIDLSDTDEFELCKDSESGDFIMEVPLASSSFSSSQKGASPPRRINISPIKASKASTPRLGALFSPLASSPRSPGEELFVPKRLSLSSPKMEAEEERMELRGAAEEEEEEEEERKGCVGITGSRSRAGAGGSPPLPLRRESTTASSSEEASLVPLSASSGWSSSQSEGEGGGSEERRREGEATPSPSLKRESSLDDDGDGGGEGTTAATPSGGAGKKKLKRRNVSIYFSSAAEEEEEEEEGGEGNT